MDREICHAVGESQLCIVNIRGTVESELLLPVWCSMSVATAGVHH